MNTVTGWIKQLALVAEWLGSAVAAVAVIAGQVNSTQITHNPTAIIAAVLALLGHATTHTTSTTAGG